MPGDSTCHGGQILLAGTCPGDGIEAEETTLYAMLNQYRNKNGLPAIPFSPSLTLVANRHARDVEENLGHVSHGWSDCRFDAGSPKTWPCMWNAPQRLGTIYPGYGFVYGFSSSGNYVRAEAAHRILT